MPISIGVTSASANLSISPFTFTTYNRIRIYFGSYQNSLLLISLHHSLFDGEVFQRKMKHFIFSVFFQMMKNVGKEQADRIFRSCDTSGDNKISLEEFRTMLSKADPPQK